MDVITLTCPDCATEFEFQLPEIRFLEPGLKRDTAPARCPQGHVRMYEVSTGGSSDA